MAARLPLFTRGPSALSQSSGDCITSPAEQRDDAKRNLFKSMRPLPTQHYWDVYLTTTTSSSSSSGEQQQQQQLTKIGERIESVQDFWRYNNNTPVEQVKTRESVYLFKSGFRPVWEDRRNILGGSWTFRVPRSQGPAFWTRIQLLAVGEKLQTAIDDADDQLCGVGLSVRFNAHLVSVWHRDASNKAAVEALLACVLEDLPADLRPREGDYFYKRHADHAGFNPPPELRAVLDSQKRT